MDHVFVPLDIHFLVHNVINAMHLMFKIAILVHKIITVQYAIQVLISQLLEAVHALLSIPFQTTHVFLVVLATVFSVILLTLVQHVH